jgi:anti-sigma B factor antagonist
MEISHQYEENKLVIRINGDLDASSSIQLDDFLDNAFKHNHYNIVVDFSQLNYISSAGVGVFISHLDTIHENKGSLLLKDMQPYVYSVFEMLNLHKLIPISNTVS